MKINFLHVLTFVLMGLVFSCSSISLNQNNRFFSEKTFNLVQKAVFEVILEKPVDDPLVYDRELNWENVPYIIRSDKYNSIGTAFAISRTELISAFHVFEMNIPKNIFIRDFEGNIYEVDQIKGGCNEKDFIVFTVKGKTFDDFLQFEKNTKMGSPVFSVGNALGEGIIIRNGFILGTVPENDSGRWNLIKSSAEGSPGNSGGPLITPEGKAVALITSRKDNILYSVPSDVILNYDQSFLSYRIKTNHSHLLVPDKISKVFETHIPLPVSFSVALNSIIDKHYQYYENILSELFLNAPEYLTGENNSYLLNSSFSLSIPQISFSYVDPDDGNWKLNRVYSRSYDLEEDGQLTHGSEYSSSFSNKFDFYKIKKPRSVSLEKINSDPKYIMDLILGNIRTERTLWGWKWGDDSDNYRILSYGDPSGIGQFRDTLGRNWITAQWNIDYNNEIIIMYILPLPNGSVVITKNVSNSFIHENKMNLQKICEHLFVNYEATFVEWTEFVNNKKYIPEYLSDLKFEWKSNEKSFTFQCGYLSLNSDTHTFNWTNNSRIIVYPFWYKNYNDLEFGISKMSLCEDYRNEHFFTLNRNIKPDPKLGTITMEKWNDYMNEKYPYNGKAVISTNENTGSIGSIIKNNLPDTVFTLYLSIEDPISEENIYKRFNAFKQGLIIRE